MCFWMCYSNMINKQLNHSVSIVLHLFETSVIRESLDLSSDGELLTRLLLFLYLYLNLFFISSKCLFGVTERFICLHNKLHLFT